MPPFEAQNPDYAAMVAASFARQGLMQALGIELVEVAPGVCVLAAAADPRLTQQQGFFHGALIGAMLDCAGGYAAYSLMPPGSEVLTTEYKVNFVAAAGGERLIARGRVLKPGRTLTVTMAEAFCAQDGVETACAVMLQSLIRVAAPR
ncbi:MAG TPA: PaaI family thioesterase [Geminicoccaceae bacterium]